MVILHQKITPALSLFEFDQIHTSKRPRILEICQVVILFRERLHVMEKDTQRQDRSLSERKKQYAKHVAAYLF